MWNRTKRMINSYLDEFIEKVSHPDREVREVTRGEVARLNELEAQARGAAKLLEKELAEVELKMIGLAKREALKKEQGDLAAASSAASALVTLNAQRELLTKQIVEAKSSAERARALREDRKQAADDLANQTHITKMRETVSGLNTAFGPNDPAATIDEMRSRLGHSSPPSIDMQIVEAEREMEAERARQAVDDLLARYKDKTGSTPAQTSSQPSSPNRSTDEEDDPQPKTLGRPEGPIRPID